MRSIIIYIIIEFYVLFLYIFYTLHKNRIVPHFFMTLMTLMTVKTGFYTKKLLFSLFFTTFAPLKIRYTIK